MKKRNATAKLALYGGKYLGNFALWGLVITLASPVLALAATCRAMERTWPLAFIVPSFFLLWLKVHDDAWAIRWLFPGKKVIEISLDLDDDRRRFQENTEYFSDGSLSEEEPISVKQGDFLLRSVPTRVLIEMSSKSQFSTKLPEEVYVPPVDQEDASSLGVGVDRDDRQYDILRRGDIHAEEFLDAGPIYKMYRPIAGTNSGLLAQWRKGPGWWLKYLIDESVYGGRFVRYLALIQFLVLGTIYLIIAAVVCWIPFSYLAVIWRLGWTLHKGWNPAQAMPWKPGEPDDAARILVLVSDSHLTVDELPYEVLEDRSLWPHPEKLDTRSRLRRILSEVTMNDHVPPLLVFCGDQVDLATASEWTAFDHELKIAKEALEARSLSSRAVFVPGNHDLCISPGDSPDNLLINREKRKKRCARWFRSWDPELAASSELAWDSYYPHSVMPLIERGEVIPTNIVLLDSCRYPSRHVLSNAIGFHGSQQLVALKETLNNVHGPLIVITHHHVAKPAAETWTLSDKLQSPFKISLDGRELLELLSGYRRRTGSDVLLLHGHQHRESFLEYTGASGGVVRIYGCPSSTMGCEINGRLDGKLRYAVASVSPDGRLTVKTHLVKDERQVEVRTKRTKLTRAQRRLQNARKKNLAK